MPSSRFPKGKVTLERALSKLGIASRTQAREWILTAKVRVNGTLRKDPRFLVTPEKIKIEIEDRAVEKQKPILLMFHKPRGVVTTRSDEKGRPTVFSYFKDRTENLHAVGRLDMATTGLLLLTNDTRLSAWLTDPVNKISRVYLVTVRGLVSMEKIKPLEGEAVKVTLRKSSGKESHLVVTLTEGKNREIRRMFESIGHEVTDLKRVQFGKLKLGDLKPGEYREIEKGDVI